MITLRKNQVEPIDKAIRFFREEKPRPSLIVLPTAWGKSILTAYVAKYSGDHLIVLQPSKELLEQNYKKYITLCGDFGSNAGIFSASCGRKEIAPITYATIGSIKALGAKFKELGFTKMLIDEAHLYPREADSMLGTFLRESGITHVLGITATPVKLQTNRDRDGCTFSKLVMLTSRSKKGNFFKDIIHVGQVLARFKAGQLRVIFNVRVLSTGFDYTGIDCIVFGISTASIALYYQIIGRATRIDKDKEDALIIDLGGNVSRFGRVEDIRFEQGKIWRMFGSGGRLLSGIPIHDIGKYTREDAQAVDTRAHAPIEIMPFGKYKGSRIADIPMQYRQWMIRSFDWNEKLRKSIIATF